MRDARHSLKGAICCLWSVVALCPVGSLGVSLPPDPSNAALLYYQAFLLRPEPNEPEKELIYDGRMEDICAYLSGAAAAFDPDVEPRLRELEARHRARLTQPREITLSEYRERSELNALRDGHDRQERLRGVDPNRVIRDYVRRCANAIELAQAASELSECDWGIQHSRGSAYPLSQLTEVRPFARILHVDALIHLADDDNRLALERCLMTRRLANHMGHEKHLLFLVSMALDGQALHCIRLILGCIEPDAEVLNWLRDQFDREAIPAASLAQMLRMDFEDVCQSVRNDRRRLNEVREAMRLKRQIRAALKQNGPPQLSQTATSKDLTDEEVEEFDRLMAALEQEPEPSGGDIEEVGDLNNLTDEALVTLAAKPYAAFLNAALETMASDMPYQGKIAKLKELEREVREQYGNNRDSQRMMLAHPERLLGLSIVILCQTEMTRVYEPHIRHLAHVTAVRAGIEVYLFRAREGHLPEVLPAGLPKDPFTGRDFKYEITDDGFMLSLPDESVLGYGLSPYQFRVRQGTDRPQN